MPGHPFRVKVGNRSGIKVIDEEFLHRRSDEEAPKSSRRKTTTVHTLCSQTLKNFFKRSKCKAVKLWLLTLREKRHATEPGKSKDFYRGGAVVCSNLHVFKLSSQRY